MSHYKNYMLLNLITKQFYFSLTFPKRKLTSCFWSKLTKIKKKMVKIDQNLEKKLLENREF